MRSNTKDLIVLVGVLSLFHAIWGLFPLLVIGALNTLFGLGIPITLKTWASMLILVGVFSLFVSRSHK
jgi:uncharacterized membrane protein